MSSLGHKHRFFPEGSPAPALPPEAEVPDDARTRILDATHQLVGQRGFDGCSIREIARVSEANPALVYYYFGSKEGLFAALAHQNADRAAVILQEAANLDGTPYQRARHFLLTWMKVLCEKQRPIAPWFRVAIQSPEPHGEVLRARVVANIGILAGILEQGIASGQLRSLAVAPQTLASGLMMSVAGIAMEVLLPHALTQVDLSTEESRASFIDGMLDAWFKGLETHSP